MYFKDNKNGKILNVLLGIIALFIIIFIISWIVNKGSNSAKKEAQFKTDLETVQATAKDYFANDLPKEIGDSKVLTLGEMYDLELTDKISYSKTECDKELSYMSVTKLNASEYKVKTNLVCGDKTDSLAEKVKSETIVKDEDGNVIIDSNDNNNTTVENDKEKNNNTTTPKDNTTNSNNNNNNTINDKTTTENTDNSTNNVESNNNSEDLISHDGKTAVSSSDGKKADVKCLGPICTFEEIKTTCNTVYEYEYIKRSASCPAGYVFSNNTCVKTTTNTVPATANYTNEYTEIVDAKINKGNSYKVYTTPTISGGDTTTYCEKGVKGEDGYCYEYTDKITTTNQTCPEGYTRNGDYCYKYTGTVDNTTYSCPTGYTKNGNACYKYVDPTTNTTTSCPSGYTKEGNYCYKYVNVNTTTNQSCPSGYTKDGNKCYIKKAVTKTTNTSCPSGYTKSGNYCYKYGTMKTTAATTTYSCPSGYRSSGSGANLKCYKTSSPYRSCNSWGNPSKSYQTTTKESTYTYETSKKVLVGTQKNLLGKTVYTYSIYYRSCSNKCSSGSLSGSTCYSYVSPKKTTKAGTSTCPSGYTKDGNKCYIKKAVTKTTNTSCPSGYSKSGNYCYKYGTMITTTNKSCPSGYTISGNKCYIKNNVTTTTNKSCPAGYTISGNTCYIKQDLNPNTTSSCPAGYTKDGDKCYIKTNINTSSTSSCPAGYTDGGNKCYIKTMPKSETSEFIYSCPAGYTKEGFGANTKCYLVKYNKDVYYCENANATLVGNKCKIKVASQYTGNTCPAGYTLSGNECIGTTTETTSPFWTNEGSMYSKEASVPGYIRTGKAKFVTSCTTVNQIYK